MNAAAMTAPSAKLHAVAHGDHRPGSLAVIMVVRHEVSQ
jgi:hypothetical protein